MRACPPLDRPMTADCAVIVRGSGMADLPEVMVTMAEAFDQQFGEAWTEPQCAGILGMPGSWLVTARIDDDPAGFALSRAIGEDGELLLIGVRPRYRGRGIGHALLDRVIVDAGRQGVASLHLEVRDGNDAIRLYERAGFQQAGRRTAYYRGRDGRAYDALTFKCDVTITSSK